MLQLELYSIIIGFYIGDLSMKYYILLAMMSIAIQGVRYENRWFATEKEAANYAKNLKYAYEKNITKLKIPGIGVGYALYAAINDKSEQYDATQICLKERIEIIKQAPIACAKKTIYEVVKAQNEKREAIMCAVDQSNAALRRLRKDASLDEIRYALTWPKMHEYDKSGKVKLSPKGKLLALLISNDEVEAEQLYRRKLQLWPMTPGLYLSRFVKRGKPWTAETLQRIVDTHELQIFFEEDYIQQLEEFYNLNY